jgi:hypothetical protein
MINTINTPLDSAPQRLYSVNVGNTGDVLLGYVLDDFMGETELFNPIIAAKLIGKDCGVTSIGNVLSDEGEQRSGLNIGNYSGDCVPVALSQTYNRSFTGCATAPRPSPLTADIGFIHLDLSSQGINILIHELADLFEHAPSRLIGNSQFPLKLFSRDTRFGGGHYKHGVKPGAERGIRFMEDSASSRRYVRPAEVAGVNFTIGYTVMGSNLLALRAVNAFRPASILEKIKAGIIGRELLLEVFYSVGFHWLSPISLYTYIITQYIRVVKGYSPNIYLWMISLPTS